MIKDAVRLSDKAWKVMPSTESMPDTDRYGFNEVKLNKVAWKNWKQIRYFQKRAPQQIADDARPSDTHDDVPSIDTHHDARPSDTHHDARIGDTRRDYRRWQWTPVEWTTDDPDTISAWGEWYQKVETDEDMVPPDFDFDPRQWWNVLVEHSIVYVARQNVYLLAQMGDAGHLHALDLINEMQHKMDNGELDNPSRWLHYHTSKVHYQMSNALNLHR